MAQLGGFRSRWKKQKRSVQAIILCCQQEQLWPRSHLHRPGALRSYKSWYKDEKRLIKQEAIPTMDRLLHLSLHARQVFLARGTLQKFDPEKQKSEKNTLKAHPCLPSGQTDMNCDGESALGLHSPQLRRQCSLKYSLVPNLPSPE